ncbi:hypothetical protein JCM19037_709 [Geomicrobium sp. JCM 19037]|uniref:phasin family protein n=1 Tax=unclassified Geomicrobium TaxID=2628951 RepID=UPI00045F28F2|nr:hypothetical protein [Geomicrobium sp. JCM 19037]GAK02474.1 hypothetical protein JCM19037_709 [Geomicrobium sp. JCM 19037]
MNDWLKNGFFLGLGAAAAGTEKVQSYLDDLVTRGRITPKEAEQFAEELISKGESKEQEWSDASKVRMKKMFKDMGLVTTDDLSRLEEQIAHLETLVNNQNDSTDSKES